MVSSQTTLRAVAAALLAATTVCAATRRTEDANAFEPLRQGPRDATAHAAAAAAVPMKLIPSSIAAATAAGALPGRTGREHDLGAGPLVMVLETEAVAENAETARRYHDRPKLRRLRGRKRARGGGAWGLQHSLDAE